MMKSSKIENAEIVSSFGNSESIHIIEK